METIYIPPMPDFTEPEDTEIARLARYRREASCWLTGYPQEPAQPITLIFPEQIE